MTRKEKIDFIRKHNKAYACHSRFYEYDDADLSKLVSETCRLSTEADKEFEEMYATPFFSWWGRVLMKLPFDIFRPWHPKNYIAYFWMFLFNPICWFLYISFGILLLLSKLSE